MCKILLPRHVTETSQQTIDVTDSSTGLVSEAYRPLDEQTNSITGRVRETPHPTNDDQEDFSKGFVKGTPHPPNEVTDSIMVPVRERRDRL